MSRKYVVRLTEEERGRLGDLVSKGRAAAKKILHAQVLLKVDADGPNWTDELAAEAVGVSTMTVHSIRERFVLEGLESALNRKKQDQPSRIPKFDGAREARLLAVACGKAPEGRARWTLRMLADKLVELKMFDSVSHEAVRQKLKKMRLSLT